MFGNEVQFSSTSMLDTQNPTYCNSWLEIPNGTGHRVSSVIAGSYYFARLSAIRESQMQDIERHEVPSMLDRGHHFPEMHLSRPRRLAAASQAPKHVGPPSCPRTTRDPPTRPTTLPDSTPRLLDVYPPSLASPRHGFSMMKEHEPQPQFQICLGPRAMSFCAIIVLMFCVGLNG